MFIKRLMSTVVLLPFIVFLLLYTSSLQFSIAMLIILSIASWEWMKMMNFSINICQIWVLIFFIFLLLSILKLAMYDNYLYIDTWLVNFKFIFWFIFLWWFLIYCFVFFYPYSSIFWKNSNFFRLLFGLFIFLPFFWSTLILHKYYYVCDDIIKLHWLLYIVVLVWINDSSAYIFGKLLGRHKFFKNVSPKKTLEGFFGGILISIGVSSYILNKYVLMNSVQFITVLICSLSAVLVSVLGDLCISMFKRSANIKDTGNFIPGHGGVLDRLDSLISSIPVFLGLMLLTCKDVLYI